MSPESSLARIKAQAQEGLIDFLTTDLELSATILNTARIERATDSGHCKQALQKVGVALDSIDRFEPRVEDPVEQAKIHERAKALRAGFDAISNG